MNSSLLNLLKANKGKGGFRADISGDQPTIYIHDVIVQDDWFGGVSAQSVIDALNAIPKNQPITIRYNSPGGDVFAARAIESHIRERTGQVTSIVDGLAASAASFLAVAGHELKMSNGSFLMIHKAWTLGLGNADDFLSTASLLEKIDGTIAQSYAEKSGSKTADEFMALMAAESWLTAEEAIALGLSDGATTSQASANAKSSWDLSAYAKDAPVIACPGGLCAANDQTIQREHEHRMRALRVASL